MGRLEVALAPGGHLAVLADQADEIGQGGAGLEKRQRLVQQVVGTRRQQRPQVRRLHRPRTTAGDDQEVLAGQGAGQFGHAGIGRLGAVQLVAAHHADQPGPLVLEPDAQGVGDRGVVPGLGLAHGSGRDGRAAVLDEGAEGLEVEGLEEADRIGPVQAGQQVVAPVERVTRFVSHRHPQALQ